MILTPPITKADQSGEIHCPFPIYLTFESVDINTAAAILDIERYAGITLTDKERRIVPLFHDAQRQPYEHPSHPGSLLTTCATHAQGLRKPRARSERST